MVLEQPSRCLAQHRGTSRWCRGLETSQPCCNFVETSLRRFRGLSGVGSGTSYSSRAGMFPLLSKHEIFGEM
jgi:hypothetical protein